MRFLISIFSTLCTLTILSLRKRKFAEIATNQKLFYYTDHKLTGRCCTVWNHNPPNNITFSLMNYIQGQFDSIYCVDMKLFRWYIPLVNIFFSSCKFTTSTITHYSYSSEQFNKFKFYEWKRQIDLLLIFNCIILFLTTCWINLNPHISVELFCFSSFFVKVFLWRYFYILNKLWSY